MHNYYTMQCNSMYVTHLHVLRDFFQKKEENILKMEFTMYLL